MIKKIIFLLIIFLSAIGFPSCVNQLAESFLRTYDDPFYDVVLADSLTKEKTIYLSWNADNASDSFYLMRSLDQKKLIFDCIYEGKQTHYEDTALDDYNCYVYRLDKKRGTKLFSGKDFSYGFSSDVRNDRSENNDTKENATFLEYDLVCNLPCIKFITKDFTQIDEDWFYVVVPPRRKAEIVINQMSPFPSSSITTLCYMIPSEKTRSVIQDVAFQICNSSYETQKMYFKISPTTTGLFQMGKSFTSIEYKISLNQIINY